MNTLRACQRFMSARAPVFAISEITGSKHKTVSTYKIKTSINKTAFYTHCFLMAVKILAASSVGNCIPNLTNLPWQINSSRSPPFTQKV